MANAQWFMLLIALIVALFTINLINSAHEAVLKMNTFIDEITYKKPAKKLKCSTIMDNGACLPGSMFIDQNLLKIRNVQNELQKRVPIDRTFHVGSRRSFHTASDGHGFADSSFQMLQIVNKRADLKLSTHDYSLKDQLQSGLRVVTLENHLFGDTIAVCHSDLEIPQLNILMPFLSNTRDRFGSVQNFACDPMSKPLSDVLWENKVKRNKFRFENLFQ